MLVRSVSVIVLILPDALCNPKLGSSSTFHFRLLA